MIMPINLSKSPPLEPDRAGGFRESLLIVTRRPSLEAAAVLVFAATMALMAFRPSRRGSFDE